MRPGEFVVHCSVRDDAGALLERLLLRAPAEARASTVLAAVLERSRAERLRGRVLMVDGPTELIALLRLCGLDPDAGRVRR